VTEPIAAVAAESRITSRLASTAAPNGRRITATPISPITIAVQRLAQQQRGADRRENADEPRHHRYDGDARAQQEEADLRPAYPLTVPIRSNSGAMQARLKRLRKKTISSGGSVSA
jgi:hypothetical protein